ncbi:hypothetical protein P4O66_004218 [Electrophorus voltai]|uniref:Uncharacterized protein n=1 Tax=Electrophorus voltai TaxID=2609070 RepID=A0AAD9E334_9TELE|nr:hypothetical protein P4O66_004218 [Electrophorus voltai]
MDPGQTTGTGTTGSTQSRTPQGSTTPTMDYHKDYVDSEKKGEYSDISLWSDFKSDHEDPPVAVEEVLHRDPPSYSDLADSDGDEPPAPKVPPEAPPRACRSGVSKLPRVTGKEASSSEEDTPPPKANSPRAHAPRPKPRRGKKAAAPVPAPEIGKTVGALPDTHMPKPEQLLLPKPAKDNPRQAGRSPIQPMTGGLAGVRFPFLDCFPTLCVVVFMCLSLSMCLSLLHLMYPSLCLSLRPCLSPSVCASLYLSSS